MTEGNRPSSIHMPEGFFTLKDDVEHECVIRGNNRCVFLAMTGFRYIANPDDHLVDYLTAKGFHGFDFTIDRI